jgi:hypothetical protein
MAKMYPKVLPDYIRSNPLRSAECHVYDGFEAQLEDAYHVFYSSPWLGLTEDGQEIDGEADFTIAHEDYGMLVVEVKGGQITIEEDTRQWFSEDRHGYVFKIKNPVIQAMKGKHQLLIKLNESPDWQSKFINAKHSVILNDTHRLNRAPGPDMPLKVFAFSEDMDNLDQWVLGRFMRETGQISPKCQPLGDKGIFALYMMLSHCVEMRLSLNRVLSQDKADIDRLTMEQYQLLVNMEENPQMAIAGAAGTGKTTLAIQKAIMCTEAGIKTLLVCYNDPLARYLNKRLSDIENLTVSTFHSFCRQIVEQAGLQLPNIRNLQNYFDKELPDSLFEAMMKCPELKYQAVIIDEGQDFTEDWLQTLECVVDDADSSIFYVFYDNNQQVQQCGLPYIRKMPVSRWKLNKNLRNTRNIFDLTSMFYTGTPVHPVGPYGQPITYVTIKKHEDDIAILKQQIGILIKQEYLNEDEITVLVSDKTARDRLTANGKLGQYPVCTGTELKEKHISIETVRRFKGLDSPVIILYQPKTYINENEMIYTGISRAQVKLIIVGDKDSIGFLKSKQPETNQWAELV